MVEATLIQPPIAPLGPRDNKWADNLFAWLERRADEDYVLSKLTDAGGTVMGLVVGNDAPEYLAAQAEVVGLDVQTGWFVDSTSGVECDDGTFLIEE